MVHAPRTTRRSTGDDVPLRLVILSVIVTLLLAGFCGYVVGHVSAPASFVHTTLASMIVKVI